MPSPRSRALPTESGETPKPHLEATPEIGGAQDIFHSKRNKITLPLIVRAQGVSMWDDEGREYLDVSSGPVVSNIGHGNARVAQAMAQQAETMDFAYSRVARHQPNIDFAQQIATLAGPGYERVCFSSGGSEAMEVALKLMRQHAVVSGEPQKSHIISLMPSYHGSTIGTLGIAGDESLQPFLEGFGRIHEKIPAPFSYRLPEGETAESHALTCARALNAKIGQIGAEKVLAFVIEPVGGLATGCLVPPSAYFAAIREICDRHRVYLVFDEILCGAGRTGQFLAAHHYPNALPDIVVLAKGLGAGYAPLGATLVSAKLVDDLTAAAGFNFMHTYAANPIACAVGLAVLEEYRNRDLMANALAMGSWIRTRLQELQAEFPIIGDIRGRGLLMAVELVEEPATKRSFPSARAVVTAFRRLALKEGLIIYARQTAGGKYGDWFMVSPPLTITRSEGEEMMARLRRTFQAFSRAG